MSPAMPSRVSGCRVRSMHASLVAVAGMLRGGGLGGGLGGGGSLAIHTQGTPAGLALGDHLGEHQHGDLRLAAGAPATGGGPPPAGGGPRQHPPPAPPPPPPPAPRAA